MTFWEIAALAAVLWIGAGALTVYLISWACGRLDRRI